MVSLFSLFQYNDYSLMASLLLCFSTTTTIWWHPCFPCYRTTTTINCIPVFPVSVRRLQFDGIPVFPVTVRWLQLGLVAAIRVAELPEGEAACHDDQGTARLPYWRMVRMHSEVGKMRPSTFDTLDTYILGSLWNENLNTKACLFCVVRKFSFSNLTIVFAKITFRPFLRKTMHSCLTFSIKTFIF